MSKILLAFLIVFYYEIVKANGIFDYKDNLQNHGSAENLIDEVLV